MLVNQLKNLNIDNKEKLINLWNKDSKFLLKEILNIVKSENRAGI